MSWILFSILAAIVWAIVNIIDKYVLTKLVKTPIIPVMLFGIIGLVISIFMYFFKGFSELSYFHIFVAFIAGFCYLLMVLFYFKAIQIEEVSRIIPLFYLTQVFVVILAAIFLGEIFTFSKYIGIFLMIVGSVLISSRKITNISLGKAFWFMVLSCLALAVNDVLTKYLLDFADYWTIFSYSRIGTFLALIPFFFISYKQLKSSFKKPKVVGLISLSEVLNLGGVLFVTIAASVGFITLVRTLSSLNAFFVLLFTIIISLFLPKILKEEINKSTIALKLLSIVLIFVGFVLVI